MKDFTATITKILPSMLPALALAFVFLLITGGKTYAQDNSAPAYQLYSIPEASATQVAQADVNFDEEELPARAGGNDASETNLRVLPAPPNDNCATALLAANTLTPGANYKCGNITSGTIEAGEYTGCFAPVPSGTVWFSFIADQSTMWICVKPVTTVCTGIASSFGIAVYQSTTCLPTSPVACLNYFSATGTNRFSKLNLTGLTVGQTYMIQVAISSVACAGNLWKAYCIKIGHPATCNTCANICGPMCVWAGPAPPTVPQITSTCPSFGWAPPMNLNDSQTNCFSFTASNDTVNLQQIVYSWCNPNTISFTYNLYTSGCAPIQSGNVFANNMITPLNVGTTYKICYTLTAACSWDSVFWPYAYTTSTTLPVSFVSFGAMPLREKVKLYWTTASEDNCKEYVVERTVNFKDYIDIGRVKGAGHSTALLNYKLFDESPAEGNSYYRIKQIDFNGNVDYTKLVAVRFSVGGPELSIVPNPATEKASLVYNAAGSFPSVLKITDMQGQLVMSREFISKEGTNQYSLDMNQLAKGIYSAQLLVDDQSMISRLVKE